MGVVGRWFRSLFGRDKKKKKKKRKRRRDTATNITVLTADREKGSWSRGFGFSGGLGNIPNITPEEAEWLRCFYSGADDEQSKHAIAVAAATTAAADAAVAAAREAAAAVVRLTNRGREKWAAVMIQSCFRGFLARKALHALRQLVKIQALVKGFLVRKQAAATLRSMQALMRAQVTIRARRLTFVSPVDDMQTRLAPSSTQATLVFDGNPKIVEVDRGRRLHVGCISGPELEEPAAKSLCSTGSECPSYMAKTETFKAKVRSRSAPKQRPEVGSERRMHPGGPPARESIVFKDVVMGKVGRSCDFSNPHHGFH